jgi:hypothetical protein
VVSGFFLVLGKGAAGRGGECWFWTREQKWWKSRRVSGQFLGWWALGFFWLFFSFFFIFLGFL